MARQLSLRLPPWRRTLLSLGGPGMMVATFAAWMATFVLGFAFVVWAQMPDAYSADREGVLPLDFIDALYYSGITGSVLGYGDITPITKPMQVVAFLQSLLGFALLTAIVTYLLSVLQGLGERNALALRLKHDVRGGNGIELVRRWIPDGDAAGLRDHVERIADKLTAVEERLHRFPLVSIYFRSPFRGQDAEPMLERLGEIAVATSLLAEHPRWRQLRPSSARLVYGVSEACMVIASQHAGRDVSAQIADPDPGDEDREVVAEVRATLEQKLGDKESLGPEDESPLTSLVHRLRLLLDDLDRLTEWRSDRELAARGK